MNTVRSPDGTRIAFWRGGHGPPLLLVHGATADHSTTWRFVRPQLEKWFTVYVMDRRGRGGSGDAPTYALLREAEDVAAVVDAIGKPVNVLGHSYGGFCAMEAALITANLERLILYEGVPLNGGTTPKGEEEYVGYSSASKVWSTESALIPQVISWAKELAWRIETHDDVQTGSGVDHLSVGIELDHLPAGILAVDWPSDAYAYVRNLIDLETGQSRRLTSFDIEIDRQASSNGTIRLLVLGPGTRFEVNHSLTEHGLMFEPVSENCGCANVTVGHDQVPLLTYFHNHPPPLFLYDFSAVREGQLFEARGELKPFEQSQFAAIPWSAEGVDIECEITKDGDVADQLSIHDFLKQRLSESNSEVVFYDHGTGEMADFVTFKHTDEAIYVSFFHCKKSARAEPGSRVEDVYEVASQVVKSLIWLRGGLTGILDQVKYRLNTREGSWFIKGDLDLLDGIATRQMVSSLFYEMVLVQPGISRSKMEANVTTALGAAERFIVDHNCMPLQVWGSE